MNPCPTVNGGTATCIAGTCGGTCSGNQCPAPPTNGVTTCSNGACAVMCGSTVCPNPPTNGQTACSNGACAVRCGSTVCPGPPSGFTTTCSTSGTCGLSCGSNVCSPGTSQTAACSNGQCVYACQDTSLTACGSSCVNTQTDPKNCNGCGQHCSTGKAGGGITATCSAGTCMQSCSAQMPNICLAGVSGLAFCSNFQTDVNNCGGCFNRCSTSSSTTPTTTNCNSGVCSGTCPASAPSYCYDSVSNLGTCVNFASDTANCGSCGHSCDTRNIYTTGFCSGSKCCTFSCPTTNGSGGALRNSASFPTASQPDNFECFYTDSNQCFYHSSTGQKISGNCVAQVSPATC